jgi:D-serine dehydratase
MQAKGDDFAYFVDDEQSLALFYGYGVAAGRLREQLNSQGIVVDATHPLFVYLPCGVGGAPSGITFGLKHLFGGNVHCFFVEPTRSACFLAQMENPSVPPVSIYEAGMDNCTEADGLAVQRASLLASAAMRTKLAGIVTTDDATLFDDLRHAFFDEGLKIEPSAAAGFSGPRMLLATGEGARYIHDRGLDAVMDDATHIVWTTGGRFVPDEEHERFLAMRPE